MPRFIHPRIVSAWRHKSVGETSVDESTQNPETPSLNATPPGLMTQTTGSSSSSPLPQSPATSLSGTFKYTVPQGRYTKTSLVPFTSVGHAWNNLVSKFHHSTPEASPTEPEPAIDDQNDLFLPDLTYGSPLIPASLIAALGLDGDDSVAFEVRPAADNILGTPSVWSLSDDGLGAQTRETSSTYESRTSVSGDSSLAAVAHESVEGPISATVLNDGRVTYTYRGLLGSGSFGAVFVAETSCSDPTLEIPKYVAVKAFAKADVADSPIAHENVKVELTLLQAITLSPDRSPFLSSVISIFQDDTHCYAVMHLSGIDMLQRLQHFPDRMGTREIIIYCAELVEGLKALHSLHCAHRDIKFANLLIGPGGHLVLADYSIAFIAGDLSLKETVIRDGEYVVASGFTAAPEQLPLGRPYNYKVDIWMLGLAILELFIGTPHPYFSEKTGDEFQGQKEILTYDMTEDIDMYVDTASGRDLLKKIFVRDPELRPDIEEIKAHPFFLEVDNFSWEGIRRGDYKVKFRPHRPTGNPSIVNNIVPRPLSASSRESMQLLDFTDPVFNFMCPVHLIAPDARVHTTWINDERGPVPHSGFDSTTIADSASSTRASSISSTKANSAFSIRSSLASA